MSKEQRGFIPPQLVLLLLSINSNRVFRQSHAKAIMYTILRTKWRTLLILVITCAYGVFEYSSVLSDRKGGGDSSILSPSSGGTAVGGAMGVFEV